MFSIAIIIFILFLTMVILGLYTGHWSHYMGAGFSNKNAPVWTKSLYLVLLGGLTLSFWLYLIYLVIS